MKNVHRYGWEGKKPLRYIENQAQTFLSHFTVYYQSKKKDKKSTFYNVLDSYAIKAF